MRWNGLIVKDGLVAMNDIPASYKMYTSACTNCKYFDSGKFICAAYRDTIPDKFLDGSAVHDTLEKGQFGNYTYTPKYSDYIPPALQ